MADKVTQALERVVGPGNAVVQVTADLDYDNTTTKTPQLHRPQRQAARRELHHREVRRQRRRRHRRRRARPGQRGQHRHHDDRRPTGSGNDYDKGSANKQNALNQTDEERQAAQGSVRKLGIGVLLNAKVAGAINPQDIQNLVTSAANLDTKTRGDQLDGHHAALRRVGRADRPPPSSPPRPPPRRRPA